MAVINSSGQQHYKGEVSRLLIASPIQRLMETFFLILFSSLIGIDAPYSFLYFNIIIPFSIIIFQILVSFSSFIISGTVRHLGVLLA